jgi:CheY-like chemotaxis protein
MISPGGKKVLLVDDEPHVRHIMRLKLESTGYTVQTASDGAEGARTADEFNPDLIISDYQMPQMNGLEMCRALGAHETHKHIPILLLTSREFEIGPVQLAGTNVKAVRDKPFSPKAILKLVEELLTANPIAR